jgi:hypothetical protein
MHRVHDRRAHGNYRNIGYDRHAQGHNDRYDRYDRYDRNKRSDRTRSGRRHS